MADRYDYKELREKAVKPDATKEDRLALLNWCQQYDEHFNGEYYEIGDRLIIKPIFVEVGKDDFELVDAEIEYY